MKMLFAAVAGLTLVVAPLAASAQPYGHGYSGEGWSGRGSSQRSYGGHDGYRGSSRGEYRSYGGRYGDRYDNGGAAVFAGLAGLMIGSALSSSQSYGYAQPYGYSQSYNYQPYGYAGGGYDQSGW